MPYDLTVRQWGEKVLHISRQRAYRIVKRCGIEIRDGKVDGVEATRIWEQSRDHRMADRGLNTAALVANAAKAAPNRNPKRRGPVLVKDEPATLVSVPESPVIAAPSLPSSEAAAPPPQLEPAGDTSRGEAQRMLEWLRVQQAEAELKKFEGTLVDANEIASATEARFRADAEALMDWPGQVSADLAAEFDLDAHSLHLALDKAVRAFMRDRSMVSVPGAAAGAVSDSVLGAAAGPAPSADSATA